MHLGPSRFLPPVFLTAALLGAAGCARSGASASATSVTVPVQTAVAVQKDMPRQIESIGTVQAVRTVSLKSQVDGVIAEIHFNEGDEVKVGDLLVALDRRPFENSLRSARADLANARAQADQAQADLDRYRRLDQQSAISKEELIQYVTKNESARAAVQSREAAVANAELQLSYAEIRAPIAGRTGQRLLHEGAVVKANDNSFAIVTINQLAPIAVAYSVPEGALPDIRAALAAGQATITATDPVADFSRTDGRLQFVDNAIDATTGTIVLKAVFANADHALWPGQFVRVVTVTGVDRGMIVLPSSAVQTGQTTTQVFVVKPDHTVDLRDVKVVRVSKDQSLLSAGVRAGETVVSDGQLRLVPGAKVESTALGGGPVNGSPAQE
jgi:multidrug efflux system membrane fusion protein